MLLQQNLHTPVTLGPQSLVALERVAGIDKSVFITTWGHFRTEQNDWLGQCGQLTDAVEPPNKGHFGLA